MLVLALDTATRPGSCALARDGVILREHAGNGTVSHAARLPGELMTLLDSTGLRLPDIDAFAVATGPGSFTGLRVGIATMQGLAFAASKPLFGISALDALARIVGPAPRVAAWIDAWRGDVFAGLYEDGRPVHAPTVGRPRELVAQLHDLPAVFVGDGVEAHLGAVSQLLTPGRHALASPLAPPAAGAVALLAMKAADAGHRPTAEMIRPLYVRRTEVEPAHDARIVR
jgi:tRNA threonylcarbamoyladenosine biosynthesis protein TsaB